MSEPDPGAPMAGDPTQGDPTQGDPTVAVARSRPVDPAEPAHDPTGLGLAQSVARSVGAQARRRQRPRRTDPQASSARPDDRDPARLSSAVDRLVESKGWSTELSVHTLLARWGLLVGSVNAAHSHPEAYADAVLTVRTDSTAWATQLRMLAPRLVAMLNEQLGQGTVTRIKVLGPDAPSWKKGRLAVRDGRGPRDTYG